MSLLPPENRYDGLTWEMIDSHPRNHGRPREGAGSLRFFCPIHWSDNQPSLQLDMETGRWQCWSGECLRWGYMEGYEKNKNGQKDVRSFRPQKSNVPQKQYTNRMIPKTEDEYKDITEMYSLRKYQMLLTQHSTAAVYLEARGIPFELAKQYGLGFAPERDGVQLFGKKSRWFRGYIIIPHTLPDGRVVSLYGRAVGADVPKWLKHRHLAKLKKGVFNAKALLEDTVFICEGAFDALSLIAQGHHNACAIFGVDGFDWGMLKAHTVIFCMDNDAAGQNWAKHAAYVASLGKEVYFLTEDTYKGCKDLNEVWVKYGFIDLGDAGQQNSEEQPEGLQSAQKVDAEDSAEPQATWDDFVRYVEDVRLRNVKLKVFAERSKDPGLLEPLSKAEKKVDRALERRNLKLLSQGIEELDTVYAVIQCVYDEVEQQKMSNERGLFLEFLYKYFTKHTASLHGIVSECVSGLIPINVLPKDLRSVVIQFHKGQAEQAEVYGAFRKVLGSMLNTDYNGYRLVKTDKTQYANYRVLAPNEELDDTKEQADSPAIRLEAKRPLYPDPSVLYSNLNK